MPQDYNDQFPIKTATACLSKWTWSSIWLNKGETASCHRVQGIPLDPNNFSNFHNLPKKIQDRELMLKGQWPSGGCEYCQKIELGGGHSDRQHNNLIGGYVPIELKIDPTATHVTPRIVEIFSHNTCNFKCIYCYEDLSSQIASENQKFGYDKGVCKNTIIPIEQIDNYFNKFLNWLEDNVQGLMRLHLLGGETFIQHELMQQVLDILGRRPNPNLQLNIFSNFNAPKKYWYGYTSQIKDLIDSGNIGRLDLTCSIDCWGPQAEYVRYGLDLNILEEYLAWAAEQSEDWLFLNINQTISSMTIRTMPELIKKLNQYNQHRQIGHYFEFIIGYNFQHPDIFDYTMWADDFDRILKTMKSDTVDHQEAITRMSGLQKRLQNTCRQDKDKIIQLHEYLDELDRRRNTDWRVLFDYLII